VSGLLQLYSLCVLVLFLKMLAISCYQGYLRIRYRAFANTEDAAFVGRAARAQDLPQVRRAGQAWANDLENIPLFFVLGALAVVLRTPDELTGLLFCIFTAARAAHTLAYLGGWQPWRTLAYGAGLACLLALAAMIGQALL
jgi:uncharacterized MAPEG superfamily protein